MKLYLDETTLPLTNLRPTESKDAEFTLHFEKHWASIYRLLRRMLGDPAEAEDLALETFLRLYQRSEKLGQAPNVGGWLYRVATNLGLHSIRGHVRRERYESAAGRFALDDPQDSDPTEVLVEREEHNLARAALANMNPRQSQLLVLRYSGMAYREIAAALNLSPTSIGPLLLRAEREFEKRYRALAQEEP